MSYIEVLCKMSVFIKFIKWLRGEKPPPTLSEIKTGLKITEMRLTRYERELAKKKKEAIKNLRKRLREGDIELAKEYAKEAILLDRDIISVLQLKSKIESIRNMVERGMIMQDIANNLRSLVPYMVQISNSIGDTELSKVFLEIARASEKMSTGEEMLISNIEDTSFVESDVEEAAEELLKRMAEKEGISVPSKKVGVSKISIEDVERILREVEEE